MDLRVILFIVIVSCGAIGFVICGITLWRQVIWIRREYDYRVRSSHMIYRWLSIRTWLKCEPEKPSKDFNWYDFYLNESSKIHRNI